VKVKIFAHHAPAMVKIEKSSRETIFYLPENMMAEKSFDNRTFD
jgi:hypothetical protein